MLLSMLVAGCVIPLSAEDELLIRSVEGGVLLENNSSERVFYMIMGEREEHLIDWFPTLDERQSVGGGEVRVVREPELWIGPSERNLIVYHWSAVRTADGTRPGPITRVSIPLPLESQPS